MAGAGAAYLCAHSLGQVTNPGASGIASVYSPSDIYSDSSPDVSRNFDRELLERQTQLQAEQREQALATLAESADRRSEELRARQWVLPVVGYRVTSLYGENSSIRSGSHTGIDLAVGSGTPIVAAVDGTIVKSGSGGACGLTTEIEYDDGWTMTYCHQSSLAASEGQQVQPGDVTGYVGSTGNSTGPHLHVEIRRPDGTLVNPAQVFAEHGVQF